MVQDFLNFVIECWKVVIGLFSSLQVGGIPYLTLIVACMMLGIVLTSFVVRFRSGGWSMPNRDSSRGVNDADK